MNRASSKITPDKVTDLSDLFSLLLRLKLFIGTGFCIFFVGAVFYLLNTTSYYKAEMVMAPADQMSGVQASSMLGDNNLYALRYLAQSVGAGSSSDFIHFENKFDGVETASILFEDEKILEGLKSDRTYKFSTAQEIVSKEELAEYVRDRVQILPVGASSLRKAVYYHPSPAFARYFLYRLHAVTDKLIRDRVFLTTNQRIDYLQESVAKTVNPEHKRALTSLLLEQERLKMLMSNDAPYAATLVETPYVSAKPVWPSAPLSFFVFCFVGSFLGFIAGLVFKREDSRQQQNIVDVPKQTPQNWTKKKHSNVNKGIKSGLWRKDVQEERCQSLG